MKPIKRNEEQIALTNPDYIFQQRICEVIAKFYSGSPAKEIVKGQIAKSEQGMYPSYAPLGYLNTIGPDGKKIMTPDPVRAPLIRKIFEWYVYDNKSTLEIRRLACKNGLKSKRGKSSVGLKTIESILHRHLYAGYFYWKGVRYNGTYEPIISIELFNQAQVLLAKSTVPDQTSANS